MLPLSLLKTAQNHPMLVELKNGETYNGHLVSCDNWMNINLREVICTSRVKLSSAFHISAITKTAETVLPIVKSGERTIVINHSLKTMQHGTKLLYCLTRCRLKLVNESQNICLIVIGMHLEVLTPLHNSGRMVISSGGCLSATSEEAPSSTCESQTRSSIW
uniref:U6 snRNA-associated Sm-like protein LSm4 n=1 Tax=Scophthalmus maximus TaxID=52904 RepID=A0A8D3E2A4_SCOMX